MPIYEYLCPGCNCKFELRRSFSQANEEAFCPSCHTAAKKLFSTFAAFSKSAEGGSSSIAGAGNICGTCAATSCTTCDIPS